MTLIKQAFFEQAGNYWFCELSYGLLKLKGLEEVPTIVSDCFLDDFESNIYWAFYGFLEDFYEAA